MTTVFLDQEAVLKADLTALTVHPDNPRVGDMAAIGESIDELDFYGAIIVQRSSNRIVAGEHRWRSLMERGETVGPVILVDIDDAKAKEIVVGDNRTHDLGGYDNAALARNMAAVPGSIPGYDPVDVASTMAAAGQTPLPIAAPPSPVNQGVRPIVLPFEIERYDRLTSALPNLRAEWDVETTAELVARMARSAVEELE